MAYVKRSTALHSTPQLLGASTGYRVELRPSSFYSFYLPIAPSGLWGGEANDLISNIWEMRRKKKVNPQRNFVQQTSFVYITLLNVCVCVRVYPSVCVCVRVRERVPQRWRLDIAIKSNKRKKNRQKNTASYVIILRCWSFWYCRALFFEEINAVCHGFDNFISSCFLFCHKLPTLILWQTKNNKKRKKNGRKKN